VIHQINAQNLTSVGSDANYEIYAVNPIDNHKTTVVATDYESP
jgi:hypothetical protein